MKLKISDTGGYQVSVYSPNEIEPKWQKKWADAKLFKTTFNPDKPKFYALDMFPYPSGSGLTCRSL